MRSSAVAVLLALESVALARDGAPAPHADDAFDLMNLLADHKLHDIRDETWNAYGQSTYITSFHNHFNAPYTNTSGAVNSLWPQPEQGFTSTFTLFVGLKLWPGGEIYAAPEIIAERPFSKLRGIGGATENFELQKTGAESLVAYRSRAYVRQTIDLGGERVFKTSDPLQLAAKTTRRRAVVTLGNFSALDLFDRNSVTGDLRRTFFNEAFMTHPAYDFPADARGYTWGAVLELYWDDWAARIGRLAPPQLPNNQTIEFRLWRQYGDTLELEHDHSILGQKGAIRVIGFHNREFMGRFDEALAAFEGDPSKNAAACQGYNYGSGNWSAPDVCWSRRLNDKFGIGLNLEQHITRDLGLFFRGMWNDGNAEVDAYDSSDRSFSFGAVATGAPWKRAFDVAGVGFAASWISDIHAKYLARGGVDAFVGDGRLNNAVESVFEVFYSLNFFKAIWLSADYQHMWNPGYNADRGPLTVVAGRVHAEF